jgi:D-3-phosphoglycerate dehydrogenase
MSVAPRNAEEGNTDLSKIDSKVEQPAGVDEKENEALMILGVEGEVGEEVRKGLVGEDGVLEAGVVVL